MFLSAPREAAAVQCVTAARAFPLRLVLGEWPLLFRKKFAQTC